jgi:hypothetical protein
MVSRMRSKTVLLLVGVALGCVHAVGCVHGASEVDPLDRVSGTEGWRVGAVESRAEEWTEWYSARRAWREATRDSRLQRQRNQGLAGLIFGQPGEPDLEAARQVIHAPSLRAGKARPGQWDRVPVERLDKNGQAIDEEGDRELERVLEDRDR